MYVVKLLNGRRQCSNDVPMFVHVDITEMISLVSYLNIIKFKYYVYVTMKWFSL